MAKPQARAPNTLALIHSLPNDIMGGDNLKQIKVWAAESDREHFINEDWALVDGAMPCFKSQSVLSSESLKSISGEELRMFMQLNTHCMTSTEQNGKAFYCQLWAEHFLFIVEVFDPETSINNMKIWRINGVIQDISSVNNDRELGSAHISAMFCLHVMFAFNVYI